MSEASPLRLQLLALFTATFLVLAYLFNPSTPGTGEDVVKGVEALRVEVARLGDMAVGSSRETATAPKTAGKPNPFANDVIPIAHHPRWRWELGGILDSEGKTEGAEIGVQRALFSKDMLRMWPGCTKYIVVDVWEQQENYVDAANVKNQDALYNEMLVNLEPYKEKVVVMRNWSHDASKKVNESSLDFIYIDARHDFEAVLEDLRDWWPKLRVGGIFAGHDFTSAKTMKGFGVQRDGSYNVGAVRGAVQQFSKEMGIPYVVLPERKGGKKAPFASWMLRKN